MNEALASIFQGVPLWLFAALATIAGAIWGSFVAALVYRWPKGEGIAHGRSRCPHCQMTLQARDLVPLFSYILNAGKCRSCNASIGPAYPLTESAAIALAILPMLLLPLPQALAAAIFGWLILPSLILDWRHLWLPQLLTAWVAGLGLLLGPILTPSVEWLDRMAAGLGAFVVLEGVRRIFLAVRGREGMGAGDPLFLGAIGLWLGWKALPVLLLLACGMGLLWAMANSIEKKPQPLFPFGTLMGAAALLLAWFPLAI